MLRWFVGFTILAAVVTGCHANKAPELSVLGVHDNAASHVFVKVTNPAKRPMRLTKLDYTFASANRGTTVAHGSLPLEREIPAGAAVVVEVPLDWANDGAEALTLRGQLTAELDEIVRTFRLAADIQPP
jgi:hypothetical protein